MQKRCMPCEFLFVNRGQVVWCQFCGKAACEKCTKKTRPFPNSVKKDRGTCCKLCDRKFFIRNMIGDAMKKLRAKDKDMQSLKDKIKEKESEISTGQKKYD